jgi:hypothetical protein
MRKILLISILLAMATTVGACSKCDFPVWGACHSGPPAGK